MKKKKNLRFYFALFMAKLAKGLLKVLHKNGTYLPGKVAICLCPDFLGRIEDPEKIIGITGTNGKTTVSNLIEDVLTQNKIDFVANRAGSNTDAGIATVFIGNSTMGGKAKKQLMVLEIDERMTVRILQHIHLDLLACTNLFRDSYKRNAHSEFIFSILNKTISPETRLILNGEDLVSGRLCLSNPRVYFGLAQDVLPESSSVENLIQDMRVCPVCGCELEYEYRRYNHIGRASCPNCGLASPKLDYMVTKADFEKRLLTIQTQDSQEIVCRMIGENITDFYNTVTAVSMLLELGLTHEQVSSAFKSMQIVQTRFNEDTVNGKRVVCMLAKGQNPIACSRAFDYVRRQPGKKAVIIMNDDLHDEQDTSENIAWIFDCDFEFLNSPDIVQVICAGVRSLDYQLRALMAGIENVQSCRKQTDTADLVRLDEVDTVFILNDLYTYSFSMQMKNRLLQRAEEEKA